MKLNYENPTSLPEITFSEVELESVANLKESLIDTLEQYKALLDMQLLLKK
jgi:hypothetical protein